MGANELVAVLVLAAVNVLAGWLARFIGWAWKRTPIRVEACRTGLRVEVGKPPAGPNNGPGRGTG